MGADGLCCILHNGSLFFHIETRAVGASNLVPTLRTNFLMQENITMKEYTTPQTSTDTPATAEDRALLAKVILCRYGKTGGFQPPPVSGVPLTAYLAKEKIVPGYSISSTQAQSFFVFTQTVLLLWQKTLATLLRRTRPQRAASRLLDNWPKVYGTAGPTRKRSSGV